MHCENYKIKLCIYYWILTFCPINSEIIYLNQIVIKWLISFCDHLLNHCGDDRLQCTWNNKTGQKKDKYIFKD